MPNTTVIGGSASGVGTGSAGSAGVIVAPVTSLAVPASSNVRSAPAVPTGASTGTSVTNGTTTATASVTSSATPGTGGVVVVQTSTVQPVAGAASQAAPSSRVETSVQAGGFQVVYSQPVASAQANGRTNGPANGQATTQPGAATGAGTATVSGTDGAGGTLSTASSFSTFRADEKPAVAIVADGNGTGGNGTGTDEKSAAQ